MKYICIQVENEKCVPYVFNKNGSKIANLFTNEIIDLNESIYDKYNIDNWQKAYPHVYDMFDEMFGNCRIYNLEDLLIYTCVSPFWEVTHEKLIDTIQRGCNMNYPGVENFFIDHKTIKSLVNMRNRYLKIEQSRTAKENKKLEKLNKEVEQTQEF